MHLTTRCPACGTFFKVVPDQLKISEGWVRCGHCQEVFDATPHVQTPALTAPSPLAPSAIQNATSPAAAEAADLAATASAAATQIQTAVQTQEPTVDAEHLHDLDEPQAPEASSDANNTQDSSLPEDVEHTPSFIRQARRQAFWQRPAIRVLLYLLFTLLLVGLALQVAVHERDELATRQPALRPTLQRLCLYLGCTIAPLRNRDQLAIDSSFFVKLAPNRYRLSVLLKNTGTLALATPWLELTLTDLQDRPVVRRVITPAELGAATLTLSAGAEWSGTVDLVLDPPAVTPATQPTVAASTNTVNPAEPATPTSWPVVGYRVLAFYP